MQPPLMRLEVHFGGRLRSLHTMLFACLRKHDNSMHMRSLVWAMNRNLGSEKRQARLETMRHSNRHERGRTQQRATPTLTTRMPTEHTSTACSTSLRTVSHFLVVHGANHHPARPAWQTTGHWLRTPAAAGTVLAETLWSPLTFTISAFTAVSPRSVTPFSSRPPPAPPPPAAGNGHRAGLAGGQVGSRSCTSPVAMYCFRPCSPPANLTGGTGCDVQQCNITRRLSSQPARMASHVMRQRACSPISQACGWQSLSQDGSTGCLSCCKCP